MLVSKKIFELSELTTIAGDTIHDVRVGWESYGELNADKSNAILVCHYFRGTSHAAGKYRESDAAPGYWDAIVGPGKAVDTNKYFVFSSDTLININANDPMVTTTGPASIDPATGKPYGMSFPLVTIADFVRVQKALVDHLGITKLRAVIGPSMGGLQTYEWAATYPDAMERIIPVIASAGPSAWLIAWLEAWAAPIRLDPNWNGGDYYGGAAPLTGLTEATRIIALQANHFQAIDAAYGLRPALPDKDPRAALDNKFAVEAAFDAACAAGALLSDANHLLYLVKANQTFIPGAGAGAKTAAEGLARIRAPALVLYSPTDLVFPQEWIKATAQAIADNGVRVESAEIAGPYGHLNGLYAIAPLGERIAAFLAQPIGADR
jgi:homoserine O-acetyltransferase/O-succinyltransferase